MRPVDPKALLETDVRAYATLSARLSEPDANRDALLAEHGLDEDSWDLLDDVWQARLSEAMEAFADVDSMPVIVKEHADAFAAAQAQAAQKNALLSLDRFIEITREIQRTNDVRHVLSRCQTTLHDYLRAEQFWLKKMMEDPALLARFERAMGRGPSV
ncbi:MAG: hypothetical protein IPK82_13850 [Polyangiaceae bacterium]|nr:hypothetical protein [Polyangiaceae bacterium]